MGAGGLRRHARGGPRRRRAGGRNGGGGKYCGDDEVLTGGEVFTQQVGGRSDGWGALGGGVNVHWGAGG